MDERFVPFLVREYVVDEESLLKLQWYGWLIGQYAFIVWEMLFRQNPSEINDKKESLSTRMP